MSNPQKEVVELSPLAHNLKFFRNRWKLTQREMAEDRFRVPRSRYGAWEEGRSEPPLAILLKFAKMTSVPVDELYNQKLDTEFRNQSPEPTYSVKQVCDAIVPVIGHGQALSDILKNLEGS